MIEFAKEYHLEGIKKLWRQTFGDEDISEFLKCYQENILVFAEDSTVCAMLSMLPISGGSKKGRYIYAVATDDNYRNQGISTKLLDYAKHYIEEMSEDFLILVPAEKSLFGFYKKRGYTTVSCVKKKEYFKNECDEVTVKKISAEELYRLRNEYFNDWQFAEWNKSDIEYINKLYGGNFFKVLDRVNTAFAVCSFYDGELEIKELCTNGIDEGVCASALMQEFCVEKCTATIPCEKGEPFAMVYPQEYKNIYFNLAMD